ncbi:MAG TPA: YceK/YidQ family lipoprotein [Urbifossiella sp.]|nr:YceK/YidQ family lipoprotein [Urbifossiella sp.]
MRTWSIWAAMAVFPVLGGCGTLNNVTEQAPAVRAYGGVRRDWEVLKMVQEDDSRIMWAFVPSLVVDLPLSLVGDTLTLPYVLVRQAISVVAGSERPADKPPTTPLEPVR